jgi:hypothetical protein
MKNTIASVRRGFKNVVPKHAEVASLEDQISQTMKLIRDKKAQIKKQ